MKGYAPEKVKNIAVLGHQGCGKTFLLESLLQSAKVISQKGSCQQGTTVSDYLKEEKENQMSISTSIIPIEFEGYKLNFLDTPGFLDLSAEVTAALRVASAAVLVIDGQSGIQVGTEKFWDFLRKYSIPTIIFIDGLAKENCNFNPIIDSIREKFGKGCMPTGVPIGEHEEFRGIARILTGKERIFNTDGTYKEVPLDEEYTAKAERFKDMMMEAVAETSDELLEKYFEGEEFTHEEIVQGTKAGLVSGDVTPILIGAAEKNIGSLALLEVLAEYTPAANEQRTQFSDTGRAVEQIKPESKFQGVVFKTVVDPFLGQLSFVQVKTGSLTKASSIHVAGERDKLKINQVLFVRGKDQVEADEVLAGDICVLTKLDDVKTGQTLCDMSLDTPLEGVPELQPTYYVALVPQSKADVDKIGSALHRIELEDRSVKVLRPKETGQLLFGTQGTKHLDLYLAKLKNQFKVSVETEDMEIVYRETIKGSSDVQGKYKKQSGGSGQYGDVHIKFSSIPYGPEDPEFVFEEEIFGGSVPKNYIPAVEKGLHEAILHGGLAQYPVIGMKAVLYDGSYHSVDSSELAFKMAASIAYKDGFAKAKPALLEPMMKVAIKVPNEYTGDVMGDMSRRRGLVRGMEPVGNLQIIDAKVPQSEMLSYTADLKSLTQARGSFEMEFECYEECPHDVSEAVIKARKEKFDKEHQH